MFQSTIHRTHSILSQFQVKLSPHNNVYMGSIPSAGSISGNMGKYSALVSTSVNIDNIHNMGTIGSLGNLLLTTGHRAPGRHGPHTPILHTIDYTGSYGRVNRGDGVLTLQPQSRPHTPHTQSPPPLLGGELRWVVYSALVT